MSEKSASIIIIILAIVCLFQFHLLGSQLDEIKSLQNEISSFECTHEEFDYYAVFEEGYNVGYDDAYSDVHSFYEEYIDSDEFLSDYCLKRDY